MEGVPIPMRSNEKIADSEKIKSKEDQEVVKYLGELGLTWDALKDKKVLDVGSGMGDFGLLAKQKGISVVSVDRYPEEYERRGGVHKGIDFVKADASALPFADDSFDYVVSHAAPPMITPTREEFLAEMRELIRVVKDGGEIRLWPSRIFPGVIRDELEAKNYDWDDLALFEEGKQELVRLFRHVEFGKVSREEQSSKPWGDEYIIVRKEVAKGKNNE